MQFSPVSLTPADITTVEAAIDAIAAGRPVLLLDDDDRENEADIVMAAEAVTIPDMALMIRECSGIVCLCLSEEMANALDLPPMVPANQSRYQTAFTVTIEAATGTTTGVSAADRVTTILAAVADDAQPAHLTRPGHVFPLRARTGGVLARRGHTEGSVDLARLAGFKPAAVLCELMNPDGSMAVGQQITAFARKHDMPVLTIAALARYLAVQTPLNRAPAASVPA
ncbi:3,4-dihydroxy-2-butanone-4-phosphate synthase [Silvimonas iriomotensis]|uniref:3,4-dihydroxy-2-butanone 4-phosphate synthase n=1 Tax=Silvimonas iriomotensis TaxID=449662 RepID=A0ABQ2PFA6_9NEIS|nr:3,4-dihydroxy-2-butanone-4-phosphate synthase [Silvimonas iriomotensis]GGP23950.1 3,4-dihydroxy-2-butanone 4-phosphate synthase [Silvimonas iriomotensis]